MNIRIFLQRNDHLAQLNKMAILNDKLNTHLRGAHKTMKNTRGEGGGGQAAPNRNTSRAFITSRLMHHPIPREPGGQPL